MKITKKIISIALALLMVFALYGCDFLGLNSNVEVPQVRLENDKLVWNSIGENASYEVEFTYLDGTKEVFEVSVCEYKVTFEKEATVKVRAIVNGKQSHYSQSIKIELPEITQLQKPKNAKVEGDKVTWDKVEYATSYEVKINGVSQIVTENSISYSNVNDNVRIEIKALSNIVLDSASTYIEVSNSKKATSNYAMNKFKGYLSSTSIINTILIDLVIENNCTEEDIDFIYENQKLITNGLNPDLQISYDVNIHNVSGVIYDLAKQYSELINDEDLLNLINSISKSEFQELALQLYGDIEGIMSEIIEFSTTLPLKFTELFKAMFSQANNSYDEKVKETKAIIDETVDCLKSYISSLTYNEEVLDKVLVELSKIIEKYTGLSLNLNIIDSKDVLDKIYFLLDYFKTIDKDDLTYMTKQMMVYTTSFEEKDAAKVLIYVAVDFVEYLDINKDEIDINVNIDAKVVYNTLLQLLASQTGDISSATEYLNQLSINEATIKELLDTLTYLYEKYKFEIDLSDEFKNKSKLVDEIYEMIFETQTSQTPIKFTKITDEQKQYLLSIEAVDFVKLLECEIVSTVVQLSVGLPDDVYETYLSILKEESNSHYNVLVNVMIEVYNNAVDYNLFEYETEDYDFMYAICKVITKSSSKLDASTLQSLLTSKLVHQIIFDMGICDNEESFNVIVSEYLTIYTNIMTKVNEISSFTSLSNECKAKIDELVIYLNSLY